MAVGKKSLGESVVSFALVGDLSLPSVIFMKIEITFAAYGNKIRRPIAEVLFCAGPGNLARSKKQRDWTPRNAVLLPPFLTETAILHGKLDMGELLKIFARSITEWASNADSRSDADEANKDNNVVTIDAKEAKAKPCKEKQASTKMASSKMLATITYNFDDVLAFL